MARAKKIKDTPQTPVNTLIRALEWCAVAQKDDGLTYQTHCIISSRALTAFNGVIAAGHIIEDELTACPHTKRLLDALERCKAGYKLTQSAADRLSIQGGPFKALIPCVDWADMTFVTPDMALVGINDNFKAGLSVVASLAKDTAEKLIASSVLIQANVVTATDLHAIIQYWHGFNGIPDLVIPKQAAQLILRTDRPLTALGWSDRTVTFWFGNDAWIRTQCYTEEWPNLSLFLDDYASPQPTPVAFLEAINAIAPFVKNDTLYLFNGIVTTANDDGIQSASFDVPGLSADCYVSLRHIQAVINHIRNIDFTKQNRSIQFNGENCRGAIVTKSPLKPV